MLSPMWFIGMAFLILSFTPGLEFFSFIAIAFFIISLFDMDY